MSADKPRWPSLDVHFCPPSAQCDIIYISYNSSPQAEGEDSILILFVQVFPQSAGDGAQKRPS